MPTLQNRMGFCHLNGLSGNAVFSGGSQRTVPYKEILGFHSDRRRAREEPHVFCQSPGTEDANGSFTPYVFLVPGFGASVVHAENAFGFVYLRTCLKAKRVNPKLPGRFCNLNHQYLHNYAYQKNEL